MLAGYITAFYKPAEWYKIAYNITSFLVLFRGTAPIIRGKNRGLNHAYLLNTILSLLTRTKKEFKIPTIIDGLEIFKKPRSNGLVICSLHMPLNKVGLRCLIENGHKPDAAIAAAFHNAVSVSAWGVTEVIPAISTGPFVLLKTKSILKKGGTVTALVDKNLGKAVSPNIFFVSREFERRCRLSAIRTPARRGY